MSASEHPAATHALRADLKPRGKQFITILALDGGGIRGIIPARVVEQIERRTKLPACRLFDLVAGTSTGGIAALGLTCPAPGGAAPLYAASDLVHLYRTQGATIFHRSPLHALVTLGGLAGPKYPADGLEQVLRRHLGAARLREALSAVLVTSYDTAAASPYLFKSYRAPSADPPPASEDPLMWEVARATAAAPTYFPPYLLEPADPSAADRSLVDGGVFANNPAMCAMADAYKLFHAYALRVLVVSVGTGDSDLRLGYSQVRNRGLVGWAIPILKMVFDGVSDTVDYQAAEMADRHYRFQIPSAPAEIDDASPDAIQRLLAAADALVAREDAALDEVSRVLVDNLSPVAPLAVPGA